jgi:hypothetical protein
LFRFVFDIFILDEKMCVDKKANYPVKVSGIEISPYPVESGEPANFKISATSGNFCLVFTVFEFLFFVLETCILINRNDFYMHQIEINLVE